MESSKEASDRVRALVVIGSGVAWKSEPTLSSIYDTNLTNFALNLSLVFARSAKPQRPTPKWHAVQRDVTDIARTR